MSGEACTAARGGRLRPILRGSPAFAAVWLGGCVAGGAGEPETAASVVGPGAPTYEALLVVAVLEPDGDGSREALATGLRHRREGRTDEALAAFASVRDGADLSDWARFLEAETLSRTGDVDGVAAALERAPDDLVGGRGWRVRVDALVAAGRPEEALGAARAALTAAHGPADSVEALLRTGHASLALGDTLAGQRDLFRHHLLRGDPAGAREALARLSRAPGVTPDAVRAARLEEIEALLSQGRWDEAGERLREAETTDRPDLRAAGLVLAGRTSLRRGRAAEAVARLEEAVVTAPGSSHAQEALYLLADLDQDDGHRERARDRFRRALHVAPGSEWGGEAAARLGTLLYTDGDPLGAAAVFETYRAAHPSGWRSQQAAFWAAMAYRRLGETEMATSLLHAAESADPVGYYGLRAARLVDRDGLAGLSAGPPASDDEHRLVRGGLQRLTALRELGLGEGAAFEERRLRRFLASRPGGLHALGEALHEEGRLLEAVRVGREARRLAGSWDRRLLRIVFPMPFRQEIFESASRWGMDPYLVAALVRQESLFEPSAVSPAGAVGLMQLLPRTARSLATRAGVGSVAADRLRDPELNLALGSLHLSDLIGLHGGRLDDVLMAYNAGDGRLARWRKHPEYGDPDAFLERIPFRETREYVRTVRENAMVYVALYGEPEAAPDRNPAPTAGAPGRTPWPHLVGRPPD